MIEPEIQPLISITREQILAQLVAISARNFPAPGGRQVSFTPVEVLLCYGLFGIIDPHHYGGNNANRFPIEVQKLAAFFRRSPASITSKMLNLDGSRKHGGRGEVVLYAFCSANPTIYPALYRAIIQAVRDIEIGEETLPDFLSLFNSNDTVEVLMGQDELPVTSSQLLQGMDSELDQLDQLFNLGEELTEKMAERKVRLSQHRFSREVIANYERTCVFCGFKPASLPVQSGLLRASHIKPWARSGNQERTDVRNGLAACPIHDAAFDQGYLGVNGGFSIHKAGVLKQSIANDPGAEIYFNQELRANLILPATAKTPRIAYLDYHRTHIFKG